MFGFGQKKKPIRFKMALNSRAGWGSGHGGWGETHNLCAKEEWPVGAAFTCLFFGFCGGP